MTGHCTERCWTAVPCPACGSPLPPRGRDTTTPDTSVTPPCPQVRIGPQGQVAVCLWPGTAYPWSVTPVDPLSIMNMSDAEVADWTRALLLTECDASWLAPLIEQAMCADHGSTQEMVAAVIGQAITAREAGGQP